MLQTWTKPLYYNEVNLMEIEEEFLIIGLNQQIKNYNVIVFLFAL